MFGCQIMALKNLEEVYYYVAYLLKITDVTVPPAGFKFE